MKRCLPNPDNLSRLDSSLVECLTTDQEDMNSNPRRAKTLVSLLGNPWGQIFYIGDPDVICLAQHICLVCSHTHTLRRQNTSLLQLHVLTDISFSNSLFCQWIPPYLVVGVSRYFPLSIPNPLLNAVQYSQFCWRHLHPSWIRDSKQLVPNNPPLFRILLFSLHKLGLFLCTK